MINREEFYKDVYSIVRQIPYGKVCTYGIIARLAGYPDHARFVGRALACAPKALALPCHRVVNAFGAIVPCWPQQRSLLEQEGVKFKKNGRVNLPEFLSLSPDYNTERNETYMDDRNHGLLFGDSFSAEK